ncbi:MAG: FAD-dependent oxidoreductase, partial [Chromatiales bacterium]|nr:FAD-dependent oxidoreductase [Chromatiales bacterium]
AHRVNKSKRIVVVGAGVAGMEAAWTAAARGHQVTVFGRSSEIGGGAYLRAQLPGGEAISSIYDYQHSAAKRFGVHIELGIDASANTIVSCTPDEVILATGASMVPPRWLPVTAREFVTDVRSAMRNLAGLQRRQSGTAVIYDMDLSEGTYACAERLHEVFERVVIVTPRDAIAEDTSMVTRQGIQRRLSNNSTEVLTLHEPRWSDAMEQGTLQVVQVYTGSCREISGVSFVAYSTPRAPNIELAAPLRAAGVNVRLIGDCLAPRSVMAATSEGHAVGHAV